MEQGPRALQQDAGAIEAVGGGVPVICVCDGHGSVAMLQMDQGKTPREVCLIALIPLKYPGLEH